MRKLKHDVYLNKQETRVLLKSLIRFKNNLLGLNQASGRAGGFDLWTVIFMQENSQKPKLS